MGVIRGSAVAVLVLLLGGLLLPGVAAGHGVSDTADVSLAQSLGGNELTVIIRRVPQVPGPLQVDVLAHRPVRPMNLRVSLGDEQLDLDVRSEGMHSVTLHVDAPGPHELVLHTGEERTLLPFRVLTPRTARWGTVPEIRSIPARPVAGQSSTLEVDTGADDVQLWLGMAGHLIIRDESGRFFAHVHELGSMTRLGMAMPDETVANYGPRLRFTFTFPAPGRYQAWVQYARNFEIHTTPLTIDVTEGEGRSNADGQHRADHHR